MFGLVSTKNLYLLKLDMVTKYIFINLDLGKYSLANTPRFTLARKDGSGYVDVFTNIEYSRGRYEGRETVVEARGIITTRKYITTKEANFILQELNPTYLKEKKVNKKKKITRNSYFFMKKNHVLMTW